MEHGLRAGWIVIAVVSFALAGCRQEAAPDASAPAPAATPAAPAAAARTGSVSISGDDALAEVLSWSLPQVELGNPARARAKAKRALAKGDLFETADSAIPLLLALQQAQPDRKDDAALLARARAALVAQGRIALQAAGDDIAALRFAQRHGTVLRTLWPQEADVQDYLADVDRAERAWNRNEAGERALAAGLLDTPGGALDDFRAALELQQGQVRAMRGIVAVESALVADAGDAARRGDFDAAYALLSRAQRVRDDAGVIASARARIEATRADLVRRLRDEGLVALADPGGLQYARGRLAEILRIARAGDPASVELRERIDLVSHYGVFRPGQVFTDGLPDGSRGPSLVVVPHGTFLMGAPDDEADSTAAEKPRHEVRFERGFAMSRTEVTVGEFARFVAATGYRPRATQRGHSIAYDVRSGNFVRGSGIDWRSGYDGRPAAPDMPVVHVTARDAEAYAEWLSAQTRVHYRLPSEAEFEYALRAGTQARYPWGDGAPPAAIENLTGGRDVSPQGRRWSNAFRGYGDGFWGPAPVGSFAANAFGLHDMAGNVSEWVADCWHTGFRRAPATGAAWVNPGCRERMYRGGSWASAPVQVRSAWRALGGKDVTNARVGFRLVRQL